jgi:methionyl-tRNA formyltransferase
VGADFVVLGCLEETRDTLRHLARLGVLPDRLIGLRAEEARRQKVTNYVDLHPVARGLNVECSEVGSYGLKDGADIELFRTLSPAILAVVGWQRLLPEVVLSTVRVAALGFHGSCQMLPWGRGRSPINWSIIEGRDRFALHMFVLTPGVDDGDVLGVQLYDINAWDSCRSTYYKTSLAQAELLARHLPRLREGRVAGLAQVGREFYYPKRTPEDGRINWRDNAEQICRLVRAVTWPYPGAFAYQANQKVMIWAAQPFSRDFFPDAQPGEVCFMSDNGTGEFVVRCGEGTVLVTGAAETEGLHEGVILQ